MRFSLIIAGALLLTPVAAMARTAPGLYASMVTEFSAARKHKKPKKAKEEYLKAAPGTGPSGPKN